MGGQSGSAMWRFDSSINQRYVNAIVATESPTTNAATRITEGKFNDLLAWREQDNTTFRPTDRSDLVNHDSWFGTSFSSMSSTSVRGWDDFSVTARIRNNGTAAASNFQVRFVATDISSNVSYGLGNTTISSLGALSSTYTTWSGTFPASIPAGNYLVGWHIDATNVVSEYNKANNQGLITSSLLQVQSTPGDIGDTLATARSTGLGLNGGAYSLNSRLGDSPQLGRDVDLFRFQATHGSTLVATTAAISGGIPVDTMLRLFDASGNELAFNDDISSTNLYSRINYAFTATGTYYIGVSGYNNRSYNPNVIGSGTAGDRGDYRLTLSVAAPDDVGNTLAASLSTGVGPLSGSFVADGVIGNGPHGSRDVDLFRFQAETGSTVTVQTSRPHGGTAMDTMLRLFDTSGNELAMDDDGGDAAYSLLGYVFSATGTYYVGVSGYHNRSYNPLQGGSGTGGSTGDYQLNLTLQPPVEIRGTKWHDLNGDGVRDPNEPGLSGWTVYLDQNRNGRFDVGESWTITDENGNYVFSNLAPGTYVVREVLPDRWVRSYPDRGLAESSSSTEHAHSESEAEQSHGHAAPLIAFGESEWIIKPHHAEPGHGGSPYSHFFAETGDEHHFAWLDQDPSTPEVIDIYYDFRPIDSYPNLITGEQQTLARLALNQWEAATGGTLRFTQHTTAAREQIINIGTGDLAALGFVSEPGGTLALGGGRFTHDIYHSITAGVVWMDMAENWDVILGNGNPAGTVDYFTVVAHEIGHALGLGHLDDLPGPSIMNGFYSGERTELSVHDILHIQEVYGSGGQPGGFTLALQAGESAHNIDFGGFQLPVANANSSYLVDEGSSIELSSLGSFDPDGVIVDYEWDFDYDGVMFHVDATGASPMFSAADIDGPATRTIGLRVRDSQGGTDIDSATVTIDNVPPTADIAGTDFAIANQLITVNVSAEDVFPADNAAGFTYQIDWKDGNSTTIDPEAENGSGVSVSHTYLAVGNYAIQVTAMDKDSGISDPATHLIEVAAVTSENLGTVLNGLGTGEGGSTDTITLTAATNDDADDLLSAINRLESPSQPVTIELNLAEETYSGLTASPPPGVTLIITGDGDTTTIEGSSPSLIVASGNVIVTGVTIRNASDSPSVVITGGNLILRHNSVYATTAGSQAAIEIHGGTVDLGTTDQSGANTLAVYAGGLAIRNLGPEHVTAIGNVFQRHDGTAMTAVTSPFDIEDMILHALDAGGGGLVTFEAERVYVTAASGSIQRGVNAVPAGGTVHVQGADYDNYYVGRKFLTVDFHQGPSFTLASDAFEEGQTSLTVIGTEEADDILFRGASSRSDVAAAFGGYPTGTFTPTARLIAYGLAGDDNIQVAGNITLTAWLFGGEGDNRIRGGGGDTLIVGGSGSDLLVGGQGRNILIAGMGSNRIVGGKDDDLLIAGRTVFDANYDALAAIMAEWTSERDFETRRLNLNGFGDGQRSNGDYYLRATSNGDHDQTVELDKVARNVITGAAGDDWFYFDPDSDRATDLRDGAFANDLDFILGEESVLEEA